MRCVCVLQKKKDEQGSNLENQVCHWKDEMISVKIDRKGVEGTSVANMVHQKNSNSHKPKGKNGVQQSADFKKKGKKTFKKNKKDEGCFTCGSV